MVDDEQAQLVAGLLEAYRQGYFPMADSPGPDGRPGRLAWFNPEQRGIIPLTRLQGLHIPRRLRDRVRSGRFTMTTDEAFEAVMRGCALPRPGEAQTWIDERIIHAYATLHRAGHAHSIEAWVGEESAAGHPLARWLPSGARTLVGGAYGVHIGGAFFAESKFCLPALGGTDASKVCLVHLIAHLARRGFSLLDTQFWNEHIDQFGCVEVAQQEYLTRLDAAVARDAAWAPFEPEADRRAV